MTRRSLFALLAGQSIVHPASPSLPEANIRLDVNGYVIAHHAHDAESDDLGEVVVGVTEVLSSIETGTSRLEDTREWRHNDNRYRLMRCKTCGVLWARPTEPK